MPDAQDEEHHEPTRLEALAFFLKTRLLIARRWGQEWDQPVPCHPPAADLLEAPVAGETRSSLWTQTSPVEFPLTAGKVQNLRAACRRLDGIEIPAGGVFSFWKQLGRTTTGRGFTTGRELRSGCIVPNLGGGLCQLSGLIHEAALQAGLEVIERHQHSRKLPGTELAPARDATVFWNYVDLRFRAAFAWRLETRLTSTELVVTIRAAAPTTAPILHPVPAPVGSPTRASAGGDCLTCGVTSCFRHPAANRDNQPAGGHTAWVLDGLWPEFQDWCQRHAHAGDHWLTPLDGHRWKKPRYAWTPPADSPVHHATWQTLRNSWQQRRLPAQGAVRQRFLLLAQQRLADALGRRLHPQARHLVISQTLLPHLWRAGHLGGRTFDVLVNRWPLARLHAILEAAAACHPESDTLTDFRADPALVRAESDALAAAARLITPHQAIADSFGTRALLLDWMMPAALPAASVPAPAFRWFFPASALARKGIHELAAALTGTQDELLVLGKAREGRHDPLPTVRHRTATVGDLPGCMALVLPAWVEHEPRLALRALASGIPVIASRECGLPPHPFQITIRAGDGPGLQQAMEQLRQAKHPTGNASCGTRNHTGTPSGFPAESPL